MQIKFDTNYLYLLFTDPYFQDSQIGVKTTHAYRLIVNYLSSAQRLSDLYQASFLNLSPCHDGSGHHYIPVNSKYRLIIQIENEQIVLRRLELQDYPK